LLRLRLLGLRLGSGRRRAAHRLEHLARTRHTVRAEPKRALGFGAGAQQPRRRGGSGGVGRVGGARFFLDPALGVFLGLASGVFLGLALVLGALLLVLGRVDLGLLLAATGVLKRGHPRFLGLASSAACSSLRAAMSSADERRGATGAARGRRRTGAGAAACGSGSGARRRFAGTAEDAALLDLDHHRVRAAMAEALLDLAGLDRALDAQRRPGTQLRLVGLVAHKFLYLLVVSQA
jgi:hypothetical protein